MDFGSILGHFGTSGAPWGPLWHLVAFLNPFLIHRGPLWEDFGGIWGTTLGPLGSILGPLAGLFRIFLQYFFRDDFGSLSEGDFHRFLIDFGINV